MANLDQLVTELKNVQLKLDQLVDAVIGDSADVNRPGLIIRVDRLERSQRNLKTTMYALGSCTLGVIGTILAAIILRYV